VSADLPSRRVCFVAPFGLGQKTTVAARTLPLARILAAQGWSVAIIIPPWDTPGDAGRRWVDAGVQVVNVSTVGGVLPTTARLLQEIRAFSPQIVHIVKPRAHAGLVQWWLWQRRRVRSAGWRLLLDVDDWEQAWAPVNRYPPTVARFLAWQEEWGLRHADGITAASHWLQARAACYSPATPTLYLPNGVARARAFGGELSEPLNSSEPAARSFPAILWFTRFVEISPVWLAEFWQSLRAIVPGAELLVAGAPVQPGLDVPFHAALGRLGAASRQVQWLGFVPPNELAGLYQRATCAIFPAAPVPLQQAKCSVRLATTLLHGVPVIASAVGEQASYGAEGAARLVAAEATPAEFAVAVAEVLYNRATGAALAASARTRLLARFNWETLGQQLMAFYGKLMH
jgi:glycosyltransferase involved in cell wall biosynthesis